MGSLKSVCVLLQRTSPEMERESKETPGGPNLPQREGTESPSWKTEGGAFGVVLERRVASPWSDGSLRFSACEEDALGSVLLCLAAIVRIAALHTLSKYSQLFIIIVIR